LAALEMIHSARLASNRLTIHAAISQSGTVKTPALSGFVGCLLILTQSTYGEDPGKIEKIRDISPDHKFAMRIWCSEEPEDANNIDSNLITAVELVSLPSKQIVMSLSQDYSGNVANLVWSSDSKWFALSNSSGPRVSDTEVYHRSGDKFDELKTEDLRADVKGDIRNEYVRPIRWAKPGVLVLEQVSMFRGGEIDDAEIQFTASFDEKTGKFHVISKKRLHPKVKKEG
jgi:hypothetical protein